MMRVYWRGEDGMTTLELSLLLALIVVLLITGWDCVATWTAQPKQQA